MTFRGMEMLYHLWKDESAGFRVPPLSDVGRNGPTLLETMPRALLHTYNLDIPEYKGGVNNAVARDARNYILNELIGELYALGITVQIPNTEREKCLCYHDCLDSFIAAIVACQWAMRERGGDQILFLTPENDPHADLAVARLEGWIYAPLL